MTQLLQVFNYSILDPQTTEFLKQKESVMSGIVGKAYTELGRELVEAQGELSKHGYGCFEEWYTSLGFKKQSVYNYIKRFELFVQLLDKRDMIEEMPSNLVYEISKPSVDPDLQTLSIIAYDVGDMEWQHAICADIEKLEGIL